MTQNLLKEIERGSKNALTKKRIITYYMYNRSSTIPDLSKELDLSVPTVTKFIMEMCDEGYIMSYGKQETSEGRPPTLYGLTSDSGYFIGVDIKKFSLNIGLMNFVGDFVDLKMGIIINCNLIAYLFSHNLCQRTFLEIKQTETVS